MKLILIMLLGGCLSTTVEGDQTPPEFGKKYDCEHREWCAGQLTEDESHVRCASSRDEAEILEYLECRDECSCFYSCEVRRTSVCLIGP